jgi:hypothetical protein
VDDASADGVVLSIEPRALSPYRVNHALIEKPMLPAQPKFHTRCRENHPVIAKPIHPSFVRRGASVCPKLVPEVLGTGKLLLLFDLLPRKPLFS